MPGSAAEPQTFEELKEYVRQLERRHAEEIFRLTTMVACCNGILEAKLPERWRQVIKMANEESAEVWRDWVRSNDSWALDSEPSQMTEGGALEPLLQAAVEIEQLRRQRRARGK